MTNIYNNCRGIITVENAIGMKLVMYGDPVPSEQLDQLYENPLANSGKLDREDMLGVMFMLDWLKTRGYSYKIMPDPRQDFIERVLIKLILGIDMVLWKWLGLKSFDMDRTKE